MEAQIITIGDEILIGQIVDTNSAWLGNELSNQGIHVQKIVSISDKEEEIKRTIEQGLAQADLLILTGGLGPTKDDITKKTIADYFNLDMYFDEALYNKLAKYFEMRGYPITDALKHQCWMPQNTVILENKMGTAPGMLFEHKGKHILSTPGVPHEMKWIFENSFKAELNKINQSEQVIYHRTVRTAGIGETTIAEKIDDIIQKFPDDISVAFLPSLGHVKVRLTRKSFDQNNNQVDHYIEAIADRLGHYVYGYEKTSLEEALLRDYKNKKLTVSCAESCTGGFLAHKLTSVPGSSAFFEGSVVAYSYEIKKSLLGVAAKTLENYGAVSEEVVLEMLTGVLNLNKTDVGISISGIAGPGGGTKEKPVGTIWLAWGDKNVQKTKKLQLGKDRLKNIEYTAVTAMNELRLFIKD